MDKNLPIEEWLLEQGAPPKPAFESLEEALRRNRVDTMHSFMQLGRKLREHIYYELVQPIETVTDEGLDILNDPLLAYRRLLERHLAAVAKIRPFTTRGGVGLGDA